MAQAQGVGAGQRLLPDYPPRLQPGLDEFFAWLSVQQPRPGFTKATVSAWRVALEARGLGAVSINVRITAVRKLAVEAADNGLLAPELVNGITRVKGVASKGVRLRNCLSVRQAQTLLNTPEIAEARNLSPHALCAPTSEALVLRISAWSCSSGSERNVSASVSTFFGPAGENVERESAASQTQRVA